MVGTSIKSFFQKKIYRPFLAVNGFPFDRSYFPFRWFFINFHIVFAINSSNFSIKIQGSLHNFWDPFIILKIKEFSKTKPVYWTYDLNKGCNFPISRQGIKILEFCEKILISHALAITCVGKQQIFLFKTFPLLRTKLR